MNINTKALKSRLSLSDYGKILNKLNIPLHSKTNSYWLFYSGDKYKDCLQHKPKLYFYLSNKVFINYSKAASYDVIGLCQARLAILNQPSSFMDAINFILSTLGIGSDIVARKNKTYNCHWEDDLGKFIRFKSTGQSLKIYDDSVLDCFPTVLPVEWVNEGISVDTMLKYHIGYYPRYNATTIPVWDDKGNLVGIRCRHWRPEEVDNGKYRPVQLLNGTIYKFPTNECFYGINYNKAEIERTGVAILVEGEKTVLKFDTLYKEKNIALAMYGKNLGTPRRNQLIQMGVNKIIYVPDNDWIGRGKEFFDVWEKEIVRFGKQFKGYAKVEVVWDNLNLLSPKDNAMDGGQEIWEKLYQNREVLI